MREVKINDNYTIRIQDQEEPFIFEAIEKGAKGSRNLIGDNLILAMLYRIEELEFLLAIKEAKQKS